jgi:hypothetical protein
VCTFLVVDKSITSNEFPNGKPAGDVNLFLDETEPHIAEINVMIAEPDSRGKGIGEEWYLYFYLI